jgi:hypothetical protein
MGGVTDFTQAAAAVDTTAVVQGIMAAAVAVVLIMRFRKQQTFRIPKVFKQEMAN